MFLTFPIMVIRVNTVENVVEWRWYNMLLIGIGTSLFTGTFCSKVLFDWLVRGMRVQRLRVG